MLPIVIPQNLLRKKERKVGENSKYLIVENGVLLTMGRLKTKCNFQNACLISSQSRYDRFDTSAYCSAFGRKASISIPEMPRGVNVSAGQITANRVKRGGKIRKTAHGSRAIDASAGRQAVTAYRPAAGRAPPKGRCSGGCTAALFPGWAAPCRESSRSRHRRRGPRGCR